MKYFITGGEGFIGYHISKELSDDHDVMTYDAQKHYIPLDKSMWPEYSQYRIQELKQAGVHIVRGDTTDRGLLEEKLKLFDPDIVIHLAALPIANVSNKYPEEAKRNIFDGTCTILDVLKDFNINRFIYTSSSMVYGDFNKDEKGNIIPAVESQHCDPLGIYGAMKLSGEIVTKAYNHRFDIPYTIIRPSAVYGPTDCNRRVTEIFVDRAMEGKRLRLDNGGHHKLDFSYVKDVVDGFILASQSEKAINDTFNITRGQGRTIKELAQAIKRYIPSTETYVEMKDVYRPNRGSLDISKAQDKIGYNPSYDLEEGMKEYIDFIRCD